MVAKHKRTGVETTEFMMVRFVLSRGISGEGKEKEGVITRDERGIEMTERRRRLVGNCTLDGGSRGEARQAYCY